MAAGDTMQGQRVESGEEFYAVDGGVWWKWNIEESDGSSGVRWMVRPPCGHQFMLADGTPHHEVEEHDDGAITVEPNPPADPENSNSILCPGCGWHGYLERGVWREV